MLAFCVRVYLLLADVDAYSYAVIRQRWDKPEQEHAAPTAEKDCASHDEFVVYVALVCNDMPAAACCTARTLPSRLLLTNVC